jgi:hypothetical protein
MPQYVEVRRVTVIAETALEKALVDEFLKLGAKGYTCVYCFGKGQHKVMEDPFTGRSLVQIQVVCKPAVADAVMAYMHQATFQNYPAIAFMDTVQVVPSDHFV